MLRSMRGGRASGGGGGGLTTLSSLNHVYEASTLVVKEVQVEEDAQKKKLKKMGSDREEKLSSPPAIPTSLSLQWGQRKRLRFAKDTMPRSSGSRDATGVCIEEDKRLPVLQPDVKVAEALPHDKNVDGFSCTPFLSSPAKDFHLKSRPRRNIPLAENSSRERDPCLSSYNNLNCMSHKRTELECLHGTRSSLVLDLPGWTKFSLSLSHKEKEEDFLAIKGSKLPQRPRKRTKQMEKTLLSICPGLYLEEITQGRYEVKEKKHRSKKYQGLKAMGSVDSGLE